MELAFSFRKGSVFYILYDELCRLCVAAPEAALVRASAVFDWISVARKLDICDVLALLAPEVNCWVLSA
jgi:hypothetical protein